MSNDLDLQSGFATFHVAFILQGGAELPGGASFEKNSYQSQSNAMTLTGTCHPQTWLCTTCPYEVEIEVALVFFSSSVC